MLHGLHGWCDAEKADAIYDAISADAARLARPLYGLEIGVWAGRSLIPAATALRHSEHGGFVVGLDSYRNADDMQGMEDTDHGKWRAPLNYEEFCVSALRLVESLSLGRWCGVFRASSADVSPLFGPLDYLHIDGAHGEEPSCRDVSLWVPKVRPGGIVILDDTDWPTVAKARAMLRERCDVEREAKTWDLLRAKGD